MGTVRAALCVAQRSRLGGWGLERAARPRRVDRPLWGVDCGHSSAARRLSRPTVRALPLPAGEPALLERVLPAGRARSRMGAMCGRPHRRVRPRCAGAAPVAARSRPGGVPGGHGTQAQGARRVGGLLLRAWGRSPQELVCFFPGASSARPGIRAVQGRRRSGRRRLARMAGSRDDRVPRHAPGGERRARGV